MGKRKPPDEDESLSKEKTITLRLEPDLFDALQRYVDAQRFPPKKQAVIEGLLKDFLKSEKFWPSTSSQEGTSK